MVWLEVIIILGAVFFGIHLSEIGISLCDGLGLTILTSGFSLQISSPPVNAILIIMAITVAALALQAAGGMDCLARVAGNFMRHNPRHISIITPIITWSMTIMTGAGFIVSSTLSVIAEVTRESGIHPSHILVGSAVTSQVAISGSPVSTTVATMLTIMEGNDIAFIQVVTVCLPASFVAAVAAALIASRQGCELQDGEIYLEHLRKGLVRKYEGQGSTTPGTKLSVILFILAMVATVILAACPQLRLGFNAGNPANTRDIIIICILVTACLMVVLYKTSADAIILTSTFRLGVNSLTVILGIVVLGMTFIDVHLAEIKDIAGDTLRAYSILLALVLFSTCVPLYSQGATAPLIIPLTAALDVSIWTALAPYVTVAEMFALPTYPTSLAAMEFDTAGAMRVGKHILSHPFMLSGLGGVTAGVVFGSIIAPAIAQSVLLRLDGLL